MHAPCQSVCCPQQPFELQLRDLSGGELHQLNMLSRHSVAAGYSRQLMWSQ